MQVIYLEWHVVFMYTNLLKYHDVCQKNVNIVPKYFI